MAHKKPCPLFTNKVPRTSKCKKVKITQVGFCEKRSLLKAYSAENNWTNKPISPQKAAED